MKRKALFVGVNTYEDEQIRDLDFSLSDAHALKTMFELFGFESDILENPNKSDVFHAVRQMTADLGTGDLFFFYFAGHGWTTTSGKHLLFCSDDMYEDLRDDDAGISFDKLKRKTNGDYNRAFVLDACRSDFITGTRGGEATTRDLRPIGDLVKDAPVKSSLAVLRSCSQYEHALEIRSRKHGLFTLAMMEVLRTSKESGIELLFGESLCDAVTDKMLCIAKAEGMSAEQTPEFAKSGMAQVLIEGSKAASSSKPLQTAGAQDYVVCPICGKHNLVTETFRCKVCGKDHICLSHFSSENLSCTGCAKFDSTVGEIKRAGDVKVLKLPGGFEIEMVWCPPGEFVMGLTRLEMKAQCECRNAEYRDPPQKLVRFENGFWMGKYEVTQAQWTSVMGDNPSKFRGECRPVETVTWGACCDFCRKSGLGLRLPTEAEWEYACRAGSRTAYCWGDALNGDRANCDGCGPFGTREKGPCVGETTCVGSYEAGKNAWGLYDMHGNVWEWCSDNTEYARRSMKQGDDPKSYPHVCRGGSWYTPAISCTSACPSGGLASDAYPDIGFRVCCSACL